MKTDKEMAEYVMNHYSKSKNDILCLSRHLERWRKDHSLFIRHPLLHGYLWGCLIGFHLMVIYSYIEEFTDK